MATKLCRGQGEPEPNPAQIDIAVPRLREIQGISRNNSNSLNSSSASPGPSGMASRKGTLQTICGNVDSPSVPSDRASQKGTIKTICDNVDSPVLPSNVHVCDDRPQAQITEVEIAFEGK